MKINSIQKPMFAVVLTLSTASVYFAQEKESTVRSKDIEQVVLTGVADIAKDRKTPVKEINIALKRYYQALDK